MDNPRRLHVGLPIRKDSHSQTRQLSPWRVRTQMHRVSEHIAPLVFSDQPSLFRVTHVMVFGVDTDDLEVAVVHGRDHEQAVEDILKSVGVKLVNPQRRFLGLQDALTAGAAHVVCDEGLDVLNAQWVLSGKQTDLLNCEPRPLRTNKPV
ncbi:hypothetical protein CC86DRAFT_3496 [Ophiobolus disseminans]|uniref:Uncharacterized protein n=1 Tax=Ophiobolus disseminans TaxID=1469910 RepID=A0A6A7AI67_9PLEO|nr:hypothetical protein CC86DRAFT_3496 [Ophiobolus disseminans]